MSGPAAWWAWAPAVVLTALALVDASTYSIAVPAAAGAVLIAGLGVALSVGRHARAPPAPPVSLALPRSHVRAAFGAGAMGREDIILLLDRLTRRILDPHLPVRPPFEVARLLRLPPEAWWRDVDDRLRALEGDR